MYVAIRRKKDLPFFLRQKRVIFLVMFQQIPSRFFKRIPKMKLRKRKLVLTDFIKIYLMIFTKIQQLEDLTKILSNSFNRNFVKKLL